MKLLYRYAFYLLVIFFSCEKNELNPEVTLVFGEAYGFCAGDCAHFFEIKNNSLYKDNIESYGVNFPTFDATPLSASDYEIAYELIVKFPQYLLDNTNQTFGCPDCVDQGGIHIFYNLGEQQYSWHIDTFVDNQPIEIRDYLKQLRDVVAVLKD